jgi:hypothetical protein
MIKGTPEIGETLYLSYNMNVVSVYAGDYKVVFHDIEYDSDEGIVAALEQKCDVQDPHSINLDCMSWMTEDAVAEGRKV